MHALSDILLTEQAKTRNNNGQHRTMRPYISCCPYGSLVSDVVRCSAYANGSKPKIAGSNPPPLRPHQLAELNANQFARGIEDTVANIVQPEELAIV